MQIEVISTGTELLKGSNINTNLAAIGCALGTIGQTVHRAQTVGDDRDALISAFHLAALNGDVILVTGGLGPTKDDITRSALAELSGSTRYVENRKQSEIIERILHSRGLDVLDINRAQALVPDRCEVILNRLGTAPVMVFRFAGNDFGHPCTLYSLPGVPYEAEGALPDIIDDIRRHHSLTAIHHRSIMTCGVAESALAKKLEDWEDSLPEDMHLAYLPDPVKGVRLRLSIYGGVREDEEKRIGNEFAKLGLLLGNIVYADYDTTLQEVIGKLLKRSGKTVSAAESCTGGTISQLLASVPGASAYYLGSVTSYAAEVKENILGVSPSIIGKYGVVSSECAAAMAEGVRRITGSDFAISTTGIAGPTGGTGENPVGTVWVGVSSGTGTETVRFRYGNDRIRNIERFASSALDVLRKKIESDTGNSESNLNK